VPREKSLSNGVTIRSLKIKGAALPSCPSLCLAHIQWLFAASVRGKHEGPPASHPRDQIGYAWYGKCFDKIADPVICVGSSSIVHEKTHEPLLSILSLIVETAVQLIKDGHRVVIVSSGAIAVGLRRMNVDKRPKYLPRIQVNKGQLLCKKTGGLTDVRLWPRWDNASL